VHRVCRGPQPFSDSASSLDDPDLNVRQFYSLTRVAGPRRTGAQRRIAENVPVMPANVGVSSMSDYNGQLGTGVFPQEFEGARVFAGPRDDGFYVDLGATFDLLQPDAVNGLGSPISRRLQRHTIAIDRSPP
jgi:hypothetical protein